MPLAFCCLNTICAQNGYAVRQLLPPSFEHCVRTHEDCFWDGDTEGFRGLYVHDQIEPRWALDGEVGRLGAAQNPTNVTAATAKHIRKVRPIGDETPCIHMSHVRIYRGQISLLRETCDACSVSEAARIGQDDVSVSVPVLCRIESAVQVSGVFYVHSSNVH